MSKPCDYCQSREHTSFYCRQKPRTAILRRSKPKVVGKAGKRTMDAVRAWKKTQQPNHQGYYECYLCHRLVPYLMAEHVKSKVRHPGLRTDPTNLRPVCSECNRLKGSNDYEEEL